MQNLSELPVRSCSGARRPEASTRTDRFIASVCQRVHVEVWWIRSFSAEETESGRVGRTLTALARNVGVRTARDSHRGSRRGRLPRVGQCLRLELDMAEALIGTIEMHHGRTPYKGRATWRADRDWGRPVAWRPQISATGRTSQTTSAAISDYYDRQNWKARSLPVLAHPPPARFVNRTA